MKKYSMFAAIAAVLSTSGLVMALGSSTNPVFITSIEVFKGAGPIEAGDQATASTTFLTFSAAPDSQPSCTASQSIFFGPPEHVRNMTSLATAAMLAGKKVKVYYTGTGGSCFTVGSLTYGKIAHLTVLQ